MNLRINIHITTSIIFSLITLISFWVFSRLFAEQSIFYLGLPFTVSVFMLSYLLLRQDNAIYSFKITHVHIPKIILGVITIVSVFAVLFVPAYDGSILEWANIPLMNWLRYMASILLAMFLPGYFLLKIIDSKNLLELYAAIPLAFVLSMFITFVTGFGLLLTNNSISLLANSLLIVVNLTLMSLYFGESFLKKPSPTTVNLNLIEAGALIATLFVVIIGNIYVMSNTLPLSGGDMWRHLAQALQYSKGFPVREGMLIPSYPYFFQVFLATFFPLSGLPSAISYQALFALSFVPVLSFYSFIKGWFSKKNICSIATLLVPLLGFGSLYTISLKAQNPTITLSAAVSTAMRKTYDINDIMVIGPMHSNVVPILFITLPTLFMFLYLLRKNMNDVTKSLLYAVLVAVSFLGHISAAFFMGLTLLLYAVIIKGEGVKVAALGGILGLLIVSLVEVSAPAKLYIWGISGFSSDSAMTFFATLLLFVLSYFTSVLVRRFKIKRNFLSDSSKRNAFSLTSGIIIFAYLFSLVTWVYFLPNYDAITFGHYNFTPFFVWATRFGPLGLLSILCLSLYLGDVVKDKILTFFLAIVAIGFAMEQIANYYPVYPAYRFATFTLIGAVILSAYFVVKSSLLFARKKKIVYTALLLFVMVPGMLSASLFYYDRARLAPSINSYEVDALSFVEQNLASNSSVLTFTSDSQKKLETFTGVNTIQIMQRWDYIFLNAVDSSILLHLLGTSNVKYIYLSPYDFEALNSSKNMLYDLLYYLPVAFRNEGVTIYELPRIVPPSAQSNFIILNPLGPNTTASEHEISQSESVLQTIPSILQLNYTISSLPLEDNVTSVAIEGLQDSSEWIATEGIGSISLNEVDTERSSAIAVQNLTADKNGYFAISANYSGDFTQFGCLRLWVKISSDIDGEVKVILRGANNTWAAWLTQNFTKNEWFPLTLQLTEPNLKSAAKLDLSNIRQVDIGFQKLHPSANYSNLKIDEIQGITSSSFLPHEAVSSLLNTSSTIMLTRDPTFDASSLSKLAESGSKIVVFDTCGDNSGFFFNFLQLSTKNYVESNVIALSTNINIPQTQVPFISTDSSDVHPTAYYKLGGTPVASFMLVKKIGLGEITYVILPSKITNTSEKTLALLMTIFDEIADIQELQTKTYEYIPNHFGSYNTVEGLTTLNGKIRISTEHIFNNSPLKSSRLEIRTGNTSEILENITIDSLKIYGPVQLVLDGQSINIQANSVSSYLTIFSDELEHPCLLELSDNTIADLSIINSSESSNLRVSGGALLLDTSEISILVKHPSIEAQGDMHFESARIQYINPYISLAGVERASLKISGNIIFTVKFTIKDLSIITDFSYDGTAVANKIPTTTQLNIQWLNILTSPISLVFYLLLLTLVLLFIIRKQMDTQND